ncbi:MAG: threonine synthase [Thermoanaerobaculia bacterium]
MSSTRSDDSFSQRNPRVRGLACFACERPHSATALATVCVRCGMPLRVDYDLSAPPPPTVLAGRPTSLWRYSEVLPIAPAAAVSLIEGWTPLVEVEPGILVKDESRNPTGSFKARGMALAVSMAKALGASSLSTPSAGNAAGALAAYGAAAGIPVTVAMPDDTPRAFVDECRHYGAEVRLVAGTISDAGRHLREQGPAGAFDVSTLREPYRIEGKKTMGFELWEQLDGQLPDVIVYPTGGGTGLIGMWKAWRELAELGWIEQDRPLPRMVSVQVAGCAPVVRAWEAGAAVTEPFPGPVTRAWGLRVPAPLGGFLCLRAVRETGGTAVAVPETAMEAGTVALARRSGLDICPEGGAAWAALATLRRAGWVKPGERVVLFNTGTGLKYR